MEAPHFRNTPEKAEERPLVPTIGVSAATIPVYLRVVDIEAFDSPYLVLAGSEGIHHH